jgi:hypothetical protein
LGGDRSLAAALQPGTPTAAQGMSLILRGPCPNAVALKSIREVSMNIHLTLGPIVSLIAGILILVMPRLLNYIVAVYLIIIGLLGLFGSGSLHLQ